MVESLVMADGFDTLDELVDDGREFTGPRVLDPRDLLGVDSLYFFEPVDVWVRVIFVEGEEFIAFLLVALPLWNSSEAPDRELSLISVSIEKCCD